MKPRLLVTKTMIHNAAKHGSAGYLRLPADVFLRLSINSGVTLEEFVSLQDKPLEEYNNATMSGKSKTLPFLEITPAGKVINHDGRHRAAALYKEDRTALMTVALIIKEGVRSHPMQVTLEGEDITSDTIPKLLFAQFSNSEINITKYLKTFVQSAAGSVSIPEHASLDYTKVYHGTYAQYVDSIMGSGLVPNGMSKNWSESKGYVYLALEPEVAEAYAASSTKLDESFTDNCVVLEIDVNLLDKDKFIKDENVDTDYTVCYNGVIHPEAISVFVWPGEESANSNLEHELEQLLTKCGWGLLSFDHSSGGFFIQVYKELLSPINPESDLSKVSECVSEWSKKHGLVVTNFNSENEYDDEGVTIDFTLNYREHSTLNDSTTKYAQSAINLITKLRLFPNNPNFTPSMVEDTRSNSVKIAFHQTDKRKSCLIPKSTSINTNTTNQIAAIVQNFIIANKPTSSFTKQQIVNMLSSELRKLQALRK